MEKENFKKFIISLYKPVKFLTITMILSMVIAQILDLVKQYIIKGIIDLPSTENFQVTDLYHVAFILLFVIVLELIFSYISPILFFLLIYIIYLKLQVVLFQVD